MAATPYSKTHRIVLLIDLNPLLSLPDRDPYISAVTAAAKTLLTFQPLSNSLFSYKFFFSSLSPLLSSSKLSSLSLPPSLSSSLSLSFNLPVPTLSSLSLAFNSLKESPHLRSDTASVSNRSSDATSFSPPCGSHVGSSSSSSTETASSSRSRGGYVVASMRQLVHDYGWDVVVRDPVVGKCCSDYHDDDGFEFVRSNLVVLFSSVPRDFDSLAEFLGVGRHDDGERFRDFSLFDSKFRGLFGSVSELFVRRDIHFSWIDVKYESGEGNLVRSDFGGELGFFKRGLRDLGWGFCSTDLVTLGSAVVPFGLVYPSIGVSSNMFSFAGDDCRKFCVQTSLEILDVKGEPLECKCGELEIVYSEMFERNRSQQCEKQKKESIVGRFCDGITKLHVKAMKVHDDHVNLEGRVCGTVVVREFSRGSDHDQKEDNNQLYADRVLQILASETGESIPRKQVPIWQILLSFLYREGYSALVSLMNGNGTSCMGILKPFTVSSALIYIIDDRVTECCGVKVSPSGDKKKTSKRSPHLRPDITWAMFLEAARKHSEMPLEDAYLAGCNDSKKLKFLKCWVKQIKKSNGCNLAKAKSSNTQKEILTEANKKVTEFSQDEEESIPLSASEEDNSLIGNCSSEMQDKDTPVFPSESLESFFSSLPSKIQQGLESEEVDLWALAQRLVSSCILCLHQQYEKENDGESGTPKLKSKNAACTSVIAGELRKLLLEVPKDMVAKHKRNNSSSKASESKSTNPSSKRIVREYELQILFRLEILGSELGATFEESEKHKFVKQICLLLEAIQCHLDGGFFGDWSLDKYVGKMIKSRYHHILGDVVDRIYTRMDLLLFTEEDESPDNLLNSDDSNRSGREKQVKNLTDDRHRTKAPVSVKDKTLHLHENSKECWKSNRGDEEATKLLEVQEKRERARRFASYTSWMPDLQRVWAPKQLKGLKAKSDPTSRLSKRKDQQRTRYDMVCETPMTGNKRSCARVSETPVTGNKRSCDSSSEFDDENPHERGKPPGGSVPKALFQDDVL